MCVESTARSFCDVGRAGRGRVRICTSCYRRGSISDRVCRRIWLWLYVFVLDLRILTKFLSFSAAAPADDPTQWCFLCPPLLAAPADEKKTPSLASSINIRLHPEIERAAGRQEAEGRTCVLKLICFLHSIRSGKLQPQFVLPTTYVLHYDTSTLPEQETLGPRRNSKVCVQEKGRRRPLKLPLVSILYERGAGVCVWRGC